MRGRRQREKRRDREIREGGDRERREIEKYERE